MQKSYTTSEFITKAKIVHGNRYSYESSIYVRSNAKLTIICPHHGAFEQRPNDHLSGKGCAACSVRYRIRYSTIDNFITNANLVHFHMYDYRRAVYDTAKTKIEIICPLHGSFWQTPNDHLSGKGCAACGLKKQALQKRTTATKNAIQFCSELYQQIYDYSHVPPDLGVSTKIDLHCPKHGRFYLSLNEHKKRGCPMCGREAGPGWYNMARLNTLNLTDTAKLYILEMKSKTETFIKIGITKLTIDQRYSIPLPYTWNILHQIERNIVDIVLLEKLVKKELKKFRYVPNSKFPGHTECYTISVLTQLSNLINRSSSNCEA